VRSSRADFAIEGAAPCFEEPVPFGQYHVPNEADYRAVLRRMERNGYFTNHGPLAIEFEQALAEYLGVAHVVVCTNEALGLAMTLQGLATNGGPSKAAGASGRVLVPALGFPEIVEAVVWAGLEPVFCDVEPDTHQISATAVDGAAHDDVRAVVILEMWGNRCDAQALSAAAARSGTDTIFYAPDGFGTAVAGRAITAPDRPTVFSFQSSRLLATMEGGCVATDDDHQAAVLRNIRSSYGAGRPTPVPVTANGRFSELQAGLGLWGLDHLGASIEHNTAVCQRYRRTLEGLDGLSLYDVGPQVRSNHQMLVAAVDASQFGLSRDDLLELLRAEGVDAQRGAWPMLPDMHSFRRLSPVGAAHPVASRLAQELLLLPVGSAVTPDIAARISELIVAARHVYTPAE
jgi:dTDP-4-amino-4,6-dideoxygalactose transaminase